MSRESLPAIRRKKFSHDAMRRYSKNVLIFSHKLRYVLTCAFAPWKLLQAISIIWSIKNASIINKHKLLDRYFLPCPSLCSKLYPKFFSVLNVSFSIFQRARPPRIICCTFSLVILILVTHDKVNSLPLIEQKKTKHKVCQSLRCPLSGNNKLIF